MSVLMQVCEPYRRFAATAIVVTALTLCVAAGAAAEPVGTELTQKLRGLLIREMVQIEAAMKETYSAIVRGDHTTVGNKAQAIHDSFIMAQSLTPQDKQDLKEAVPTEFLRMDARFHQLSGSLAEAGRQQDTQAQIKFFSRMTETCVACHSRYVTDRFPKLQEQSLPDWWGDAQAGE